MRTISPIEGYPEEIRDAFVGIILNAIDALPNGGEIYLTAEENSGFAWIYVQDNGVGIRDDIRLKNTKSVINRHAQELLDPKQPGIFNEAIMELGATVCRPQSPKCTFCPINELCIANNKNQTNIIPLKSRREQRTSRMINFYILKYEKSFLLVKRPQKGLLAGLWEFPASQIISEGNNPGKLIFPEWMNIREKPQKVWQPIKHTYTHFNATYHPYLFIINNRDFIPAGYEEHKWISLAEIARLPIHRAMQKTVEKISSDLEIIA